MLYETMALIVDSVTYSLVINSADRISGTNNNATYQINWRDFLPDNYDTYKVAFSFQTIGGYYGDGVFSNTGPNIGYTALTTTTAITAANVLVLPVTATAGVVVNQYMIGQGISPGTTVLAINANNITLSIATLNVVPNGAQVYFYAAANVNTATFSSARVLLMTQGRSFSFDTQNKGPSMNVGVLQRDIQLASSKSNALSCFYCQNPPRTMSRPNQNLMTINIMNSYSFAGGIVGYNNLVPVYSAAVTNQNFMTDTNASGSVLANDMTGYTMLLEFIPIASSSNHSRSGI
jgi:hypothetical protein